MIALYPDQIHSLNGVVAAMRANYRKIMLRLPTGGGKTVIAARIARGAREKGKRVCFAVDSITLVDQTVDRFREFGVTEIGVIQADHPLTDRDQPVQVASIQSLARRKMSQYHFDIVIIDEAHCVYESVVKWMDDWNAVTFLGLSATPWTKGLGKHWDVLVEGSTVAEMIESGRLCKYRMFAPSHPDLKGVKVSKGDYDVNQLSDRMTKGALVADMTKHWREHALGLPTLAFCVDRVHAQYVQQQFLSEGVPCGYIDAYTPRDEREEIGRALACGELSVVSSVGCLTKGVDWDVRCILLARPTKSDMLYMQIIGRGLRIAKGKEYCLILDHSDTALRLGLPEDVEAKYDRLDDGTPKKSARNEDEEPLPKKCGSCGFVKPPKVHACPSCGFAPTKQHEVDEVQADLKEIKRKKHEMTPGQRGRFYAELKGYAEERGFKPGWAANQYRERFGIWPNKYRDVVPVAPSPETRSWCKSRIIRYAHRRRATA